MTTSCLSDQSFPTFALLLSFSKIFLRIQHQRSRQGFHDSTDRHRRFTDEREESSTVIGAKQRRPRSSQMRMQGESGSRNRPIGRIGIKQGTPAGARARARARARPLCEIAKLRTIDCERSRSATTDFIPGWCQGRFTTRHEVPIACRQ